MTSIQLLHNLLAAAKLADSDVRNNLDLYATDAKESALYAVQNFFNKIMKQKQKARPDYSQK